MEENNNNYDSDDTDGYDDHIGYSDHDLIYSSSTHLNGSEG